jgi:predicted small lipoprotein YifL
MRRAFHFMLAGCAVVALSACGHLEPWVKPYERDRLADPIMSWDRDALSKEYVTHIYDSREASRGATGTSGGGCGCN